MWRSIYLTIFTLILLLVAASPSEVAAYPPCGDLQPPNTPGSFCRPMFGAGQLVHLRDQVSFGWLHTGPTVRTPIVDTIMPSPYANLRIVDGCGCNCSYWDGYQWWWQVQRYPENIQVSGWIEQATLAAGSQSLDRSGLYEMKNWETPVAGRVEPGIPFLWLRNLPSSTAQVITTIPANGTLTILGPSSTDGNQIWWRVQAGEYIGYVEQSLIIALP